VASSTVRTNLAPLFSSSSFFPRRPPPPVGNTISHTAIMTIGQKKVVDTALRAAVNLRSSALPSQIIKTSTALFSAYGGAQHALPDLAFDYDALQRESSSISTVSSYSLLKQITHSLIPSTPSFR
jgi:hypothetical protein